MLSMRTGHAKGLGTGQYLPQERCHDEHGGCGHRVSVVRGGEECSYDLEYEQLQRIGLITPHWGRGIGEGLTLGEGHWGGAHTGGGALGRLTVA